jgi:TRAP-type C4-dicarboxylate transport system permease small subunit
MNLETAWRKMGAISSLLARVGALALFLMTLLTTADVIGRYVFNAPIVGAFEITEFLILILIFSFVGYAQAEKSHISVDLLFSRFSRRVQIFVDLFNHSVCLALVGLVAWMGLQQGLELKEVAERSSNLGIPRYPFAFFLAFGCAVMCIEFIRDLMRLAMSLRESDV